MVFAAGKAKVVFLKNKVNLIKGLFDFAISLVGILLLSVPMLIIAVLVKLTSDGPALYWSDRVGREQHDFQNAQISHHEGEHAYCRHSPVGFPGTIPDTDRQIVAKIQSG